MDIFIKIAIAFGIVLYLIWSAYAIYIMREGLSAERTSDEAVVSGVWVFVTAVGIVYGILELLW